MADELVGDMPHSPSIEYYGSPNKARRAIVGKYWKWYILLLASVLTFGGYYSFDFPSVTHNQLYRHFTQGINGEDEHTIKKRFEFQFNLLFSLYSLPNTILPFVSGVAIDKWGNNRVIFLTATLVLIGNLLQTYSCYSVDMTSFLVGRFLFGLGAESLQVCANIIISKWFSGSELAFAMALNLSACKLGGVLTDWFSPVFEHMYGVTIASCIVSTLCVLCYLSGVLLIYEENKTERQFHERFLASETKVDYLSISHQTNANNHQHRNNQNKHNDNRYQRVNYSEDQLEVDHFNRLINNSYQSGLNITESHVDLTKEVTTSGDGKQSGDDVPLHERRSRTAGNLHSTRDIEMPTINETSSLLANGHEEKDSAEKEILIQYEQSEPHSVFYNLYLELKLLSFIAWLLFIFTFLMYGTFIPFSNISNSVILEIFYTRQHKTVDIKSFEIEAARLQSVPYMLTVILTPTLGILVDWFGHRTFLLFAATVSLCAAHWFIYTATIGAFIPLLLIGVAYSVFGTVSWPCVPLIVEEKLHGTAYGLMAAFQNSAQFLVPLILAEIFRLTEDYRMYEICFIVTSLLAMAVSIIMWYLDEKTANGNLRNPSIPE